MAAIHSRKEPHEDRQHYYDPAPPGQPVIIQGDGLDAAEKLLFGDESVPFKVSSTGSIEATVPHGSGTVDVTVELEDGGKSTASASPSLR